MATEQLSMLTMVLKPATGMDRFRQSRSLGPNLQGVLMEHIDKEYASVLHQLPFNPYSQHCMWEGNELVWRVNALTHEAAASVIDPIRKLEKVTVRGAGTTFEVAKTSLETLSLKSLLGGINEPGEDKVSVRFVTPTSFKSRGSYVIMPSVRLMLQNLLMHYGQVYDSNKEGYSETIEYVDQYVRILSYNLRSCYFGNVAGGQRRIPAFVGTMTLGLRGAEMTAGLVRMLLRFGEFAGVGIKTSMGMGGFRIVRDA